MYLSCSDILIELTNKQPSIILWLTSALKSQSGGVSWVKVLTNAFKFSLKILSRHFRDGQCRGGDGVLWGVLGDSINRHTDLLRE